MKILILETNLLWSTRLAKTAKALGHEVVVADEPKEKADVAIINLEDFPEDAIRRACESGAWTIGHAGHKEKELMRRGHDAGCNRVVSNGQLAHGLPQLLEEMTLAR